MRSGEAPSSQTRRRCAATSRQTGARARSTTVTTTAITTSTATPATSSTITGTTTCHPFHPRASNDLDSARGDRHGRRRWTSASRYFSTLRRAHTLRPPHPRRNAGAAATACAWRSAPVGGEPGVEHRQRPAVEAAQGAAESGGQGPGAVLKGHTRYSASIFWIVPVRPVRRVTRPRGPGRSGARRLSGRARLRPRRRRTRHPSRRLRPPGRRGDRGGPRGARRGRRPGGAVLHPARQAVAAPSCAVWRAEGWPSR